MNIKEIFDDNCSAVSDKLVKTSNGGTTSYMWILVGRLFDYEASRDCCSHSSIIIPYQFSSKFINWFIFYYFFENTLNTTYCIFVRNIHITSHITLCPSSCLILHITLRINNHHFAQIVDFWKQPCRLHMGPADTKN